MSSTIVQGIGRLLTNDPMIGRGATGELTDAWVVIVGDAIAELGTGRPPSADTAIEADGRCVMPGFVDSHSHVVFAGDRSAEFAAR
ncbi:MAG TPA: imidazolonepropionase, partial [Desertimonas sp.]|nr:imidazolonepropionase [Desertimonas sp.]